MANFKVDTKKHKTGKIIKDADGAQWRVTQGGHLRNTKTGELYSGKTMPGTPEMAPPDSITPPAPTPNPQPQTSATVPGLSTGTIGTGNPLESATQAQIRSLFGKEASPAATSAQELFKSTVPLIHLAPEISQGEQQALGGMQEVLNAAKVKDPNQIAAMNRFNNWAEQGMAAPDITAIREQGLNQVQGGLQDALRQIQLRQGLSGAMSPMGLQDALRSNMLARSALERDLAVQNIGFKQQNAQDFANFSNKVNNDYLSNWGNAATSYWAGQNTAGNTVRNILDRNAQEDVNYGLGSLGALSGGAQTFWGRKDADRMYELAKKGLSSSSSIGTGAGGGSSGGVEIWKKTPTTTGKALTYAG